MDEIVGEFRTILVYALDHGELAGEHGSWWILTEWGLDLQPTTTNNQYFYRSLKR